MKIDEIIETLEIEDGTYVAVIDEAFEYVPDELCMKHALVDDAQKRILVKFYSKKELGRGIWHHVFRALDTYETDDLIGKKVKLEVKNTKSKKTGKNFCNVVNVEVVS